MSGQAPGFRPEQQHVPVLKPYLAGRRAALGGQRELARGGVVPAEAGVVRVHGDVGVFTVVQPGAAQAPLIQLETERLDQMQGGAGVGGQAHDVAGVGRYFRLEQSNIQHSRIPGYKSG